MILHFLLGVANATSFYIQPFSVAVGEATLIAHGTLSNIHTENAISPEGSKIIYTYATLEVKELIKGSIPKQTILVREIGGSKDGYTLSIPGSPEFKDGEDTVLFLGPEKDDQSHEIVGLELGKYALEDKDGIQILKGGIFNYVKHGEPHAAEAQAENEHPWSLGDLKALIEKQGGRSAAASSAAHSNKAAGAPGTLSFSPADSANAPPDLKSTSSSPPSAATQEGPIGISVMRYVAFGLATLFFLFFLFRKR